MKKNLFPTILISVLLAFWGLVIFGYNFSQALTTGSSGVAKPTTGDTLKNGLVGWWTMDGVDINATQALDKSGQGNTGTRNAVTAAIGKIGQAFYFDGASSFVNLTGTPTPLQVNTGTISAWIRTANAGSSYRGIVAKSSAYGMYLKDNVFMVFDPGASADRSTGVNLGNNKWHHVVVAFNSGVTNGTFLYIDGVLSLTTTFTIASQVASVVIGEGQGGVGQIFKGLIDDVRIYNRVLSASEVSALYKYGQAKVASSQTAKPTTGNTLKTGLMGWWTMDGMDTTVNTTTDKSGQGNHGTRGTATSVTPGKIGQAMKFRGVFGSDRNVIADQSYFSPVNNSMTITGWFQTTATSRSTVVGKSSAIQYEWAVELNGLVSNKLTFQLWQASGVGYGDASSVTVVNDGKWHYFAATIDYGVNQQLFVDGRLEGTDTSFAGSMSDLVANLGIAGRPDDVNLFPGSIDDVRIYNRILSVGEIQQLYKLGNSKTASSLQNAPTNGNSLRNGLIGWWTMDGQDTTLTTVTDRSGQGWNGTRTNGVRPVAGKIGQGMFFDGVNDHIKVSSLTTTDANSFGGWFKTTQTGYITMIDNQVAGVNTDGGINLFMNSGNAYPTCRWDIQGDTEVAQIASASPINNGKWHHVFCTKDSNDKFDTYVDGVNTNSGTQAVNDVSSSSTLFIGTYSDAGALSWNGSMDDIRIYNRALSAAEVVRLYRGGR